MTSLRVIFLRGQDSEWTKDRPGKTPESDVFLTWETLPEMLMCQHWLLATSFVQRWTRACWAHTGASTCVSATGTAGTTVSAAKGTPWMPIRRRVQVRPAYLVGADENFYLGTYSPGFGLALCLSANCFLAGLLLLTNNFLKKENEKKSGVTHIVAGYSTKCRVLPRI